MKKRTFIKRYIPFPIFLLAGLLLMLRPVADMDEIWNYGFASYICDGMLPYADFNMVQTPLAAYLAAAFLCVFGEHLAVFRILGAVLFALTFGMAHLLAFRLTGRASLAFTVASFLAALCSLVWMYNYNHLNLLILLLILYCELRLTQMPQGNAGWLHVLVGLLYGLTPVIKQSTGALLLAYLVGSCSVGWFSGKKNRMYLLLRVGCAMIPGVLFLASLLAAGNFQAFLDYAVKGVGTFTHRQTWLTYVTSGPIDFTVGLFPVAVTMLSVYTLAKGKSKVGRQFHLGALLLCWAGVFVAFPICDFVHMCVAAVPFVVPLLCCIRDIQITAKEGSLCCAVAVAVLLCYPVTNLEKLDSCKISDISCYAGLPINPEIEAQIEAVDAYVLAEAEKGTEVILAHEYAAAYMLPLGIYRKDFNLLLVGNVGTQSVEELLRYKDAVYLVAGDNMKSNYQAHRELIAYIKENYEKIGEVSYFDAYAPK